MKEQFAIILILSQLTTGCGQHYCDKAALHSRNDFSQGNYFFHSLDFLPPDNTYLFVLREDYNIQWRFNNKGSLDYYGCYDSTLTQLLNNKYGHDFLEKAKAKADSLEGTDNWRSKPEFPDGQIAMYKFINDRLVINPSDFGEQITTKIIIQFTITENGKLEDIRVMKGISDKIDKKVIQIFKEMPNWKPAYLYGETIKERVTFPLIIELG